MKVYLSSDGVIAENGGVFRLLPGGVGIDSLFQQENALQFLRDAFAKGTELEALPTTLRAPVQSQEVWAAGVTYLRSRVARVAESKDAGGAGFYDKVYEAERPELFFKAAAHRVAGVGEAVRIRRDARWNVPEPELTLAVNAGGRIFGYTIGNDMSSRDIEAENPLYLPQAKVYDQSAALGPCILISDTPPPVTTAIALEIRRGGATAFAGTTTLQQIKRSLGELAGYLYRDQSFPHGCFLMTGTGIVPPDTFTLEPGDEVSITIDGIGTLKNPVTRAS